LAVLDAELRNDDDDDDGDDEHADANHADDDDDEEGNPAAQDAAYYDMMSKALRAGGAMDDEYLDELPGDAAVKEDAQVDAIITEEDRINDLLAMAKLKLAEKERHNH
jgi:hypothetical protein